MQVRVMSFPHWLPTRFRRQIEYENHNPLWTDFLRLVLSGRHKVRTQPGLGCRVLGL